MDISKMKTIDQVHAEDLANDPEYRAEWDRTAYARQVAIAVVKYRADRGLSQRALAAATGLTQPAIARLELGEQSPSLATLVRLSAGTGLAFQVVVVDGRAGLATPAARAKKAPTRTTAKAAKTTLRNAASALSQASKGKPAKAVPTPRRRSVSA